MRPRGRSFSRETGEPSSVIEPLQQIRCEGFRAQLTPFACIINQLYPKGWNPCETCKQGATITVSKQPPPVLVKTAGGVNVGGELAWDFEKPRRKRREERRYDPKQMSLAVARSLGLA